MSKKQPPQTNKRYTDEFKSEAIKLAERLSVAEAAEKLGIYPSQIYSWRSTLNNSRTGVERESLLLATENARLKRQLAEQAEELEILKKAAKLFKVTTDSNHALPVAPNLLARDFSAQQPNEKWVTDITYIQTTEGWLYLAVMIDLYSRMIVGWSMSKHIDAQLGV